MHDAGEAEADDRASMHDAEEEEEEEASVRVETRSV